VIAPGRHELAVLTLADDGDVFAARQLGRDLATDLGLERLDVTRVATAISELTREAAGTGRVAFAVRGSGELLVTVTAPGPLAEVAVGAARRLVDALTVASTDAGTTLELTMEARTVVSTEDVARLRARVAEQVPTSPLDELRRQHEELLTVFDAVQAKNAELEILNRELEETNRGVMALYTELSGELERTNQGVVALYAEIDDKNAQLSAASEAKSRFLRSMSHELRTPANSIVGLTRLMTDPAASELSAEQAEQVGFIRASANDLLTLVNELLDLAKAESGRFVPVAHEVDLTAVVAELGQQVRPLLREGVRLIADVPVGATVRSDPDLLRHVLRNLLSNAAKFTADGSVTVSVRGEGDGTAISVVDTGLGMSEEERARVFEEFFQARTPLHATTKGTGLGLSFAASVAQALGGEIEVTSSPGAGSRFTLHLPPTPPEVTT
jgi:signal transduction histidine kinase